jgi:hypothetical protein
MAEELIQGVGTESEMVPQRLNPHRKYSMYGTAEAVPLGKRGCWETVDIFRT